MGAREILEEVSETAALDAQTLLAHIVGRPRAWLLAHPGDDLTDEQARALQAALERLQAGEPLPYILGHWEFYGLDFAVSPAVLIPRPETELLIERALIWLRMHPGQRQAVDVGCGSGCIAISLAVHIPDLHLTAVDISMSALHLAQANARRHAAAERIAWMQSDLLGALTGQFNLICANLPYIPESILPSLAVARYEPRLALDGGEDGLALIRCLLDQAAARLAPDGLALLEIEASQGEAVCALAQAAFPAAHVTVLPDLAGHMRLVVVE